jgi:hypothetical protein
METIQSRHELLAMIRVLEKKERYHEEAIKESVEQVLQNLQPAHLVKNTFRGIFSKKPEVRSGLVTIAAGATVGFLVRKLLGVSPLGKGGHLIYDIIQQGVSGFLTHKARKSKLRSV